MSRILRIVNRRSDRRRFGNVVENDMEGDLNFARFFKYMFLPALGFGGKYMAGDAIAQSMNSQDFMIKRNFQWGAFGLSMSLVFYSPMWIRIYPRFIKRYKYGNIGVAGFQTFIFEPFLFMPCFYYSSAIFNNEFESDMTWNVFKKWADNFWTDVKALSAYGIPVFGLNATVVPLKYRSWFVTLCGTFFSAFIIYMKVDATTEDIVLPRNAIKIINQEYLPVVWGILGSEHREDLLKLAETDAISLDDFRAYCKRNHPQWNEECIRRVFDSMDADKSGNIDLEEIAAYFDGAKLLVDNRQMMLDWFDSVDKTKDGVLDREELCEELKRWFHDDYVLKLFERMDSEQNGLVSKEEFMLFLDLNKGYE